MRDELLLQLLVLRLPLLEQLRERRDFLGLLVRLALQPPLRGLQALQPLLRSEELLLEREDFLPEVDYLLVLLDGLFFEPGGVDLLGLVQVHEGEVFGLELAFEVLALLLQVAYLELGVFDRLLLFAGLKVQIVDEEVLFFEIFEEMAVFGLELEQLLLENSEFERLLLGSGGFLEFQGEEALFDLGLEFLGFFDVLIQLDNFSLKVNILGHLSLILVF